MKVSELSGAMLDYWVAKADESWKWAHRLFPTMTLNPTFASVELYTYENGNRECLLIPNNSFRQDTQVFSPSTDWAHGGPIIERDQIFLDPPSDVHYNGKLFHGWVSYADWRATVSSRTRTYPNPNFSDPENWPGCVGRGAGETPLIAAMRAKVSSHYGDEVPDEVA
jgi:hypothetical protein